MTTRIGVLTAGGDAAGLNAAIRAVVRTAIGVHADRIVATRFGEAATELVAEGGFGQMVALHGDRIGQVQLAEAAKVRPVPEELVAVAELFFEERRRP